MRKTKKFNKRRILALVTVAAAVCTSIPAGAAGFTARIEQEQETGRVGFNVTCGADIEGRTIAARYDEQGRLTGAEISEVSRKEGETLSVSAEADDSVRLFIWSRDGFKPLCEGFEYKAPAPITENTSFEDKLLRYMPEKESYMISPMSLKTVLAMLANGAQGESKAEIMSTAGIDDLDAYNNKTKSFIERFNSLSENKDDSGAADYPTEFKTANSIWINKDDETMGSAAEFSQEYKAKIGEYFSAESAGVDNSSAVDTINNWISKKTNGKITEIIDSSKFAAMLVNTIYMRAAWEHQFDEANTYKEVFTDSNGSVQELDFMHNEFSASYYDGGDVKMAELPYREGASMYIVMGEHSPSELNEFKNNADAKRIAVSLPKWTTETGCDFTEIFKLMGMNKPFDAGHDFAPMLTNSLNDLVLTYIIHKTYINVDENGVEAAAVTASGAAGAAPNEPVEFKADKPFSYYICDSATDEIIFMGRFTGVD